MIRLGLPLLVLLPALASPTGADTIYLVDGSPIEDVEIEEETITSVTYEQNGRLQSVPSERVERVVFERLPDALDEGETYVREGDLAGGLDVIAQYLDGIMGGARERKIWAPPYAAKRVIDLSRSVGDLDRVQSTAGWLLETYDESRYVPSAYVALADAQARLGDVEGANKTLRDFQQVVADRGLPARWRLECDLALVLTDPSIVGEARREKLTEIERDAVDFPGVRSRAKLARAESLVKQAVGKSSGRAELLARAKALFEEVLGNEYASDEVLAGAYTGTGDCLFYGKGDDSARFLEAGMNYMRVVVLYREFSHYVAKSMFYAGRCFDQLDEDEHKRKAQRLYRSVLSEFPGSNWATEARNFL